MHCEHERSLVVVDTRCTRIIGVLRGVACRCVEDSGCLHALGGYHSEAVLVHAPVKLSPINPKE